jgi:hypothetical protein
MEEHEMGIGFPELIVLLFGGVIGVGFYAFLLLALWKFYQMLSRMNENIAGIRQLLDRTVDR